MNNEDRLSAIIRQLEEIVVTSGQDRGVILKSWDSPTHRDTVDGESITVYDHENFSELGDALIELYELASQAEIRWYTWEQVSRELWNGDIWWYDDGETIYPVNISWDPTRECFFATTGQWGWSRARDLQEMGGRWRPCIEPEPDTAYRMGGEAPAPETEAQPPVCPECGGTQLCDSGGVWPDGKSIELPCPACFPPGKEYPC